MNCAASVYVVANASGPDTYVVAASPLEAARTTAAYLKETGRVADGKVAVNRCLTPELKGVMVPVEPTHDYVIVNGRVTRPGCRLPFAIGRQGASIVNKKLDIGPT